MTEQASQPSFKLTTVEEDEENLNAFMDNYVYKNPFADIVAADVVNDDSSTTTNFQPAAAAAATAVDVGAAAAVAAATKDEVTLSIIHRQQQQQQPSSESQLATMNDEDARLLPATKNKFQPDIAISSDTILTTDHQIKNIVDYQITNSSSYQYTSETRNNCMYAKYLSCREVSFANKKILRW